STSTPEIYPLSLHDALPILLLGRTGGPAAHADRQRHQQRRAAYRHRRSRSSAVPAVGAPLPPALQGQAPVREHHQATAPHGLSLDRKSTRLNSSHVKISYAV